MKNLLITGGAGFIGTNFIYAINADKISSNLGYSPKKAFKAGIKQTMEWFMEKHIWNPRI